MSQTPVSWSRGGLVNGGRPCNGCQLNCHKRSGPANLAIPVPKLFWRLLLMVTLLYLGISRVSKIPIGWYASAGFFSSLYDYNVWGQVMFPEYEPQADKRTFRKPFVWNRIAGARSKSTESRLARVQSTAGVIRRKPDPDCPEAVAGDRIVGTVQPPQPPHMLTGHHWARDTASSYREACSLKVDRK